MRKFPKPEPTGDPMPKGELVVTLRVADLEPFKTFLEDVENLADEARLFWPTTDIGDRLGETLERFRTYRLYDDQGEPL